MESGTSNGTHDGGEISARRQWTDAQSGAQDSAPLANERDQAAPQDGKRSTSQRIASELPGHATRAMASATAKGMGVPGPLQPVVVAVAVRAGRWLLGAARRYPMASVIVGGVVVAALVFGSKRAGGPEV
jgi:hypothetical protein